MWSISHHKGYRSRSSWVRPPNPCGLICRGPLLGRRPPPGLSTGSPVTSCFHCSGCRLPWSPMQSGRAWTSGLALPPLLLARWVGWVAPVCPTVVGSFGSVRCCCCCGVLGGLAPVHRCARSAVVLRVRRPGQLGPCSLVRPPGVLCSVCGVLGHLAPIHRCARSVRCFACAVSWATCLLFTGVPAWFVVLRLRCPGLLGPCSPGCPLGAFFCLCSVLGHLAPVHRCARLVCCVPCAVSWATWLLFSGVPARCVVLRVRWSGPLGSCSPVCPLGALLCVCSVLGHSAPVHRCARPLRCFACAVSWATWLLFIGVPAWFVVLPLRCPGPLGSCSPVRPLGALLCCCGVLGHYAPVHRRALCCVCSVLSHLAPVHRCVRSVCCVACAVSGATWLLFIGVPAWFVVLHLRCPGPLGSCSPVRPLGALLCCCGVLGHFAPAHRRALCCVCSVLSHLAPVHLCVCSVCCVAYAVSGATWLLFSGVPAGFVAELVRCHGPLGSCSTLCSLRVLCCVCSVLGHLAPVHRCARCVLCFARAVSWATWLVSTGVPARCVVLRVRPPGPLGSCSPVCSLGVLCLVCGILGLFAPVHRRARSLCCAVGWVCGPSLRGAHSSIRMATIRSRQRLVSLPGALSSIWMAAVCSRQGLGTPRARSRPSRRWLFRSREGLGCCRASTRPSRRRLLLVGTCSRAVVRCVFCALSGCAAPGGCCCLAPVRVPWLWRRRASLACHVAPRGAPRLVRSGCSRCSGQLSRRRGASFHPGDLRPRLYCVAARGTRRPAENRAHCACRWPLPRQGRRACSAPYPFRAPRWGCPWQVSQASVLGCVRHGGLRVWTRSLTRPASCTVRRSL